MSIDVTAWVTHSTREPSDDLLMRMSRWWYDATGFSESGFPAPRTPGVCDWVEDPLHTFVLSHVDRASHKRRLRTLYISGGSCEGADHGYGPTSTLISGDAYGPQPLSVHHCEQATPLACGIKLAAEHPYTVLIPVFEEEEFTDSDYFHEHHSSRIEPLTHGVVLPFMRVQATHDPAADALAAADREDLLRAQGYSTYVVDLGPESDTLEAQREFAMLMEDVFDEIAYIKADAEARVLTNSPRWPLVVIRVAADAE